jgi:predicted dehydrogenase
MVTAILRFENGAVGTLDVNWLTPTKIRELWVHGERGMFHVNYLTQDLTLFENASAVGSAEVLLFVGIAEGRSIRFPIQRIEPLRAELEHFIECIEKGTAPIVPGEEAVRALDLAQRLLDSAREHRPIAV